MAPHLRDRMFHVIVLGGIGLLGLEGCGSVAHGAADDAGGKASDAGPAKDARSTDAGTPVGEGLDAFPSETATFVDAFPVEGFDAFPSEGPVFAPDASTMLDATFDADSTGDAAGDAECFPEETAVALDANVCSHVRRTKP